MSTKALVISYGTSYRYSAAELHSVANVHAHAKKTRKAARMVASIHYSILPLQASPGMAVDAPLLVQLRN